MADSSPFDKKFFTVHDLKDVPVEELQDRFTDLVSNICVVGAAIEDRTAGNGQSDPGTVIGLITMYAVDGVKAMYGIEGSAARAVHRDDIEKELGNV